MVSLLFNSSKISIIFTLTSKKGFIYPNLEYIDRLERRIL